MYSREEYEAKRNERYERLQAAARKAQNEAGHLVATAKAMADVIPFGQPILVGHHSEKSDRAFRGRIESKFRKGFELYEKSARLSERADAAKDNHAIFSDNPDAVELLTERVAQLEKRQELMTAANKIVRKKNRDDVAALEALLDLGFEEDFAKQLVHGRPHCFQLGFQRYELSNNGANILRLKKRAEQVAKRQATETWEEKIGDVRIEFNAGENRIRIYFAGRVSHDLFMELRRNGFKKAPSLGDFGFSNFYNNWAAENARRLADQWTRERAGKE
jgi:hypothetical protein